MQVVVRWLLAVIVGSVCAWPVTAAAQSELDPTSTSVTSAEAVRAAFTDMGLQADPIVNWDRTAAPVRSFVVHDSANQRVLMVLVFPSGQAAGLLRGVMALENESMTATPHVLAGYGPSVWMGNVGIMQSTEAQLERLAQLQTDESNGAPEDASTRLETRAPNIPVDLDFQQALRASVFHL